MLLAFAAGLNSLGYCEGQYRQQNINVVFQTLSIKFPMDYLLPVSLGHSLSTKPLYLFQETVGV